MKIKWNIVNRTGEASDTIASKLRPKITKLEKLLTHFPQNTVHLQIILDARPHDKTYQVRLNLRVPSDVLHVASESHSLVGAFGEAVRMLVRRLKRLKARYRRDHEWKATQVSVDLDVEPGSPSAGEDDMEPEEFALNLLQRQLEPDEQTLADTIPDTHIDSPYSYVAKEDLLSNLAELSRQWPKADREIF